MEFRIRAGAGGAEGSVSWCVCMYVCVLGITQDFSVMADAGRGAGGQDTPVSLMPLDKSALESLFTDNLKINWLPQTSNYNITVGVKKAFTATLMISLRFLFCWKQAQTAFSPFFCYHLSFLKLPITGTFFFHPEKYECLKLLARLVFMDIPVWKYFNETTSVITIFFM